MEKPKIVYQNIEESPFSLKYEEFEFFFSSQFYKRNFKKRVDSYILEETYKIKNRYNASCSGDLWIEVLPGWTIVRDHSLDTKVVRDIYTSSPLIFMGWNVKPEILHTPLNIGHIAPTIAHFMRIRAPNAAALSPIMDVRK